MTEIEQLRQQNAELTAELQATRLQMITDFGQYQEAHEKVKELTAEVERLKTVPMKYRRMAFNAQLQDENNQLRQQNSELTAQRDGLLAALEEISDDYADRFDLGSPSTNPGIKYVVEQARTAIANCKEQK